MTKSEKARITGVSIEGLVTSSGRVRLFVGDVEIDGLLSVALDKLNGNEATKATIELIVDIE